MNWKKWNKKAVLNLNHIVSAVQTVIISFQFLDKFTFNILNNICNFRSWFLCLNTEVLWTFVDFNICFCSSKPSKEEMQVTFVVGDISTFYDREANLLVLTSFKIIKRNLSWESFLPWKHYVSLMQFICDLSK